ncbi:MAG: elongation factor P 5-aminopentanone reductase [Lachnospiraceae bacterium]
MNKNVLITGASHGIGKATAIRFAKDGYRLFLNCMRSEDELQALKSELQRKYSVDCITYIGDISSSDFIEKMFADIETRFGGVDILINNAGISHIGLLSDMTDEEWRHLMSVNLDSVFYCCRAAIPHMVSQKSGRIVNVSSVWGNIGASMETAYSASKGAVNAFTKALAKELAPSDIPVNAVAFGTIDTRMNSCFSKEERLAIEDEIPMGRYGTTKEAAEVIYQLAISPAYLTGQIVTVDGGWC